MVHAALYQCVTTKKRIIAAFTNTACGISQTTAETMFFPSSSYRRPLEFDLLPPPFVGPEASD